MTAKDCLFCKIVNGEVKSNFIYDSEKTVAFDDINPVASTHVLIVPKKHIESTSVVSTADGGDVVDLFKAATKISLQKELSAYRLTFNAGRYQHVGHLHMHLLAGGKVDWGKL